MQNVQILELSAATIYLMDLSDFEYIKIIHLLNDDEKNHLNKIKSEQKKKEFAAVRWMKTNLFGAESILYSEDGSPTINQSSFISISHTTKYACLGVSKTSKIGIDIEEIRAKAVSVQHKFCNENEATIFDITNNLDMTLLWSLKEALYKLSDRQQLLFKTDICIDKRLPEIVARIRFESGLKTVSLGFQLIDNHILTFTTSASL
jgi:4'-phosphopantetheinyl transferase EntD